MPEQVLRIWGLSRRAPHHVNNEDAWCSYHDPHPDPDQPNRGQLIGVCDGVSTSGRGDLASNLGCAKLGQFFDPSTSPALEGLLELVSEIDWELRGTERGGATTLSAVWINDGVSQIVTIGDSPVFLLRRGEAECFNPAEPKGSRKRPAFLGTDGSISDHWKTAERVVHPGDVFMMLTDGASNTVEADELMEIWDRTRDPQRCAHAIIDQVARVGVSDDATVVVIEVRLAERQLGNTAPSEAPDPPAHLAPGQG